MTTKSKRLPEDILWEQVIQGLDGSGSLSEPGPSCTEILIDLSSDSPPVPAPRQKVPETSPIPRPRTFQESTPSDDFELVDYENGQANRSIFRQSPDSHFTALLETPVIAFEFESDGRFREIKLDRGTLLKPLLKPDSRMAHCLQKLGPDSNDLLFTDLMRRNVGTIVRGSNIMRLTDDQTLLLLPATPEERLDLHKDLERFHFVENVKVGDAVSVVAENNFTMHQGKVVGIGERTRELGTWYNVEIKPNTSMNVPEWGMPPPPRQIYANAAHIHKSLRNVYEEMPPTVYQPEIRNIPIKRVETQFNADNTTTQTLRLQYSASDAFARDLHNWDGDPRTVQEPLREWRSKETRKSGSSRGRTMSNGTQPSRSQSAHTVVCYDKTVSVDDLAKTSGSRVGDRCVWHDGHRYNKGTLRFIGHLKGHSSLYAGIEFDEPVGKGTGMFQGEPIFQTAEDRAGFVVLNSLEILPRQQEVHKEKPLSVKHKQASAESLSDPVQNGHYAPPVPPRPVMKAEDYLIDSFSVGSYVEVCHLGACRSGVIRWIGDYMSEDGDHLEKHSTVELDADIPYNWKMAPYECNPSAYQRAVFVPTTALRRDRMTGPETSLLAETDFNNSKQDFGSIDSGIETVPCEPWRGTDDLIGRMKGIQGHKNSCYIDATLYAMFVQSTAFDHLLERKPRKSDIPQYSQLIRLLSTEIVYPLRKFHYVRADHVMKIRELFAELMPGVKGLTSEEKDPEEILGQLFGNILKAEPFVHLIGKDNRIDHTFLCPMVVEDWQGGVATTQHLLERHMRAAGLKFASLPKTLILQLPRYGQEKVFDKILPLERIDITGLVHSAASPCFGCGKPADGMCPECFLCKRVFLTEVSYCAKCFKSYHFNSGEGDHVIRYFYPQGKTMKKCSSIKMVLSAVLCIETSHYVAFVRSVTGRWLFFDSMADREGLSKGFNVPQVKECERMSWWLSQSGWERLRDADINGSTKTILGRGSDVDPLVTRFLSDSYICFYHEDSTGSEPSSSTTNKFSATLGNMMQKMKI